MSSTDWQGSEETKPCFSFYKVYIVFQLFCESFPAPDLDFLHQAGPPVTPDPPPHMTLIVGKCGEKRKGINRDIAKGTMDL